MKTRPLIISILIVCAVAITAAWLFYRHQREIDQAIANAKQSDAQSWKDAGILANIESESGQQEMNYYFEILQLDSPTSQKLLDHEQLEQQFIQEWFASKRAEQISAGADAWVIQQIDETMHKTELKAVQDTSMVISNLPSSGVSNP